MAKMVVNGWMTRSLRYFTGKFLFSKVQCKCIQKDTKRILRFPLKWLESHGLMLYVEIFPLENGSLSDSMFLLQIYKSANSIRDTLYPH